MYLKPWVFDPPPSATASSAMCSTSDSGKCPGSEGGTLSVGGSVRQRLSLQIESTQGLHRECMKIIRVDLPVVFKYSAFRYKWHIFPTNLMLSHVARP